VLPALVAVAHGTVSAVGLRTVYELTAAVHAERPDLIVLTGFVDVADPTLASVLSRLDGPAVLVPILLSGGYHVRTDIPAVLAGRPDTVVTAALGPDRQVSLALAERLAQARGTRPQADRVALVSAGSSDPLARADVEAAAADLSALLQTPVDVAVLTGDGATLSDVRLAHPDATIEVATYLLAEGVFAGRLRTEADRLALPVVSATLGAHPTLVDLVLRRFGSALEI
jgi:sirohydrochlorin ferrochelatase